MLGFLKANMRKVLLVFLMIAALVPPITAQTKSGTLLGIVRDEKKALIPGAQITLTNAETKETYKVKSSEAGEYKFEVPAGMYSVTAELPGFNPVKVVDIRVNQDESKRVDPMTLTTSSDAPPNIQKGVVPIPLAPVTSQPYNRL